MPDVIMKCDYCKNHFLVKEPEAIIMLETGGNICCSAGCAIKLLAEKVKDDAIQQ